MQILVSYNHLNTVHCKAIIIVALQCFKYSYKIGISRESGEIMSLKEQLLSYTKEVYPMHMPGHKGGRYRLIDDLYKVDVTEVPETDHLYQPEGILAESLAGLSEFYGTKKSVYLVNGSTVGILSAIGGLHQENDEILIARNCHQSVYNAVAMYHLQPKYIFPKMTQWGITGGIDPEDVKQVLAANPRIVSFVITSPTYDGFLSDIGRIKAICKRYNVLLVVDEAHGSHLPFSNGFPASAIEQGADVVIHSLHKTMPVVTGAGMLHLNLPVEEEKAIMSFLGKLQTSSPSYIMMAQMDACIKELGNNEKLWKELVGNIEAVNKSLKKMKKLYALTGYVSPEEGIVAMDQLKSIILTKGVRENGHDLFSRLRSHHQLQMELSDEIHALGIITLADSKKALNRYGKALLSVDKRFKKADGSQRTYRLPMTSSTKMMPYEVALQKKEAVLLKDAADRISASMITPYPPGIPALVAGELFTEEMIQHIEDWLEKGIDVLGMESGYVLVVKDML